MLKEAEQFSAEDKKQKERVEAKNNLENYAYNVRNTLADDALASKLSSEDKANLQKAVDETISWLDKNQTAEKDEFEYQKKELEGLVNPVMMKLYQQQPGAEMPGASANRTRPAGGAKVEEVD